MKKNKNVKILIAFSLIFLVIIITAFYIRGIKKSTESDGIQFVIGMSQANLSEPWRISMNEDIAYEAKKYKNVKIIYKDAGGSTDKQKNDINELLDSGIDLLIVSVNDSQKLTPVVSKAYKSIPVIVLDRAVEGYDYTLYIGPDNESIGKQAGNFVSDLIGNKEGNVIEVQGLLDSPPAVERSKGFKDAIKEHENIKIYRTVTCEWQKDEAEDKITDILNEDKNIDVIFAHSDYMALGAYKAASKAGLNNIKIIGVDGLSGEDGGVDLVHKGILQATFTCTTGGKEAVDYAVDILNKKEGIPRKIILKSDKITRKNVDEYLSVNKNINKDNKKIVMGYAQLSAESKWRVANERSIKDAAKKAGIELVFLEGGTTQEDQKKLIRELIKRKVDIISFSPLVQSGWDDVLKEAKEAKIPVIISDRSVDSDSSLWTCNIGSDFCEEGRRAGRCIMENYTNAKNAVNVIEIKGNVGSTPSIERDNGLKQILSGDDKYNIVSAGWGDFTYDGGKKTMEKLLNTYKGKIDVVYAQNDDMALGAISAIKEHRLLPGKDILVLGTDATREGLKAIKSGEMFCTVECNPLLGIQLMNTARKVVSGVEVPLKIVNAENVFKKGITSKDISKREY